jgi:hypothetical protein
MKDYGWTLGELDGELLSRGIDLESVPDREIHRVMDSTSPEWAAERIAARYGLSPDYEEW